MGRGSDGEVRGKKVGGGLEPSEGSWLWPDVDGSGLGGLDWRGENAE